MIVRHGYSMEWEWMDENWFTSAQERIAELSERVFLLAGCPVIKFRDEWERRRFKALARRIPGWGVPQGSGKCLHMLVPVV